MFGAYDRKGTFPAPPQKKAVRRTVRRMVQEARAVAVPLREPTKAEQRETIENTLRILRGRQSDGCDTSPKATAGLIRFHEERLAALSL